MKYCPKCKKLYLEEDTRMCFECKNSTLSDIEDKNTPVFLCFGNAAKREQVMNALNHNNIPCSYSNTSANNGMGFEEFNIFVPYKFMADAYNICVGMGILDYNERLVEFFEKEDFSEDEELNEYEQMSPAKRTTIKVITAILFLIVVGAVVLGVDFVMNLIKNLFM